jgi:NADH-quinone oxidoreductase subunit E
MIPDIRPEHPDITDEMWSQIDKIIADNKSVPGSIIGVLRECQDVAG